MAAGVLPLGKGKNFCMNIVITGATSGIGKALGLHYASPDTTLGLIGRRQELLSAVAAQCQDQGAKVVARPADVQDEAAMQTYTEQFLDQTGGIDIVIANAGSSNPDALISGDAGHHARLFEVNVIGLLNTLLPFVPQMVRQRHGQLVAIASVAGFRAMPGSTTYAATKMAVRALMEGYGRELQRYGIITTTINPGFVVSEMTANNTFKMPFLLPTDAAAGKIVRAIARQRRVYTFPWQMAIIARLLPYIPGTLLQRAKPHSNA
jgi:short-subunit dehydrogenase